MFDLLKPEPLIDVTQPGDVRAINEKAGVFDMVFITEILNKLPEFLSI